MAREFNGKITGRFSTVRLRTWTLTLAMIVALVFYLLMSVTFRDRIAWVDFIILATLQIITNSIYFPDGDLYGQKDKSFIANKDNYNEKANEINTNMRTGELRRYCEWEYEERKKRYLESECGTIGITLEELHIIGEQTPEKEIRHLESFEFGERKVRFSRWKRRRIRHLLHGKIPVKPNHAETIMSAVENDGTSVVKDGSVAYKRGSYVRKFLQAVIVGGVMAYIGYTAKDGIGLAEITKIIAMVTSIFATAVTSFSRGENASRVYKNRFYVELAIFIDCFNEWAMQKNEKNFEKTIDNTEEMV